MRFRFTRGETFMRVRTASAGWLTMVAMTPATAPDTSDTSSWCDGRQRKSEEAKDGNQINDCGVKSATVYVRVLVRRGRGEGGGVRRRRQRNVMGRPPSRPSKMRIIASGSAQPPMSCCYT